MARPATVVIGAGIVGCLVARELAARDPEVSITVPGRDSGRVFCDAYGPDTEPLIRALDGTGRIVFSGAANGSGYRLAPAMASEAADLLHLHRSEGVTGDHQYV
jgi:glycine/D-amino acid oxidase-like deaminating enzyme